MNRILVDQAQKTMQTPNTAASQKTQGGLFKNMLMESMSQTQQSSASPAGTSSLNSTLNTSSLTEMLSNEEGIKNMLLLLCMTLSSGSQNGVGAMMTSLSTAITGLPADQQEALRRNILDTDNDPVALDKINSEVFKNTETNIPYQPGKAVNPSIMSNAANRSASLYRSVIDQFSVETNPRYAIRNGSTYCNIFMWDVTRAMGAEIPHYIDPKTQAPRYYPDVKGASQMNANATYNWLHEHGSDYGWYEVTPEQAQVLANQGHPAVTAYKNPGGHGHVQVVCPSQDGRYDAKRGVTIAQAGRHFYNYAPITKVYNKSLPKVSYFAHI